ncbi:hypothetical protein [Fibrella arboris]|uniref:hypothetical protein n=1 Tax=Fibrella arboris TaxID=3242486 RepID=UPI00351FC158
MLIFTRLVVYATLAYTLLTLPLLGQVRSALPPTRSLSPRQADSLRRRQLAEQLRRTIDPALGRVPTERLEAIQNQLTSQLPGQQQGRARTAIPDVAWTERGPFGFTGTLHTFLADPADPTGRIVWAGSTNAGLWKNANLIDPATNWVPISDSWESKNISALASDPTNSSVIYAATGYPLGQTNGGGIWKTTNRGATWLRLSATTPAQSGTLIQAAFNRIAGLVVTKTGLLLAGTQGGVLRSADQGQSWQFSLAPQRQIGSQSVSGGNDHVSAIRLGQDGLVYVAMATGRLFRSTSAAANAWTEITPPNMAPYTGIRTELVVAAPASGTAQTLYAAQIADDASLGGYTLHWLQYSTNSGQTWQPMTRPVYQDAPDLDITLGLGAQYFTLSVSPDSAQVVYITAYDRLYRSGNGGNTWSAGQSIGRTTAFSPLPNQGVVWGSDSQVYFSTTQQLLTLGLDGVEHYRSNGFGGLEIAGLAMKNVARSRYRLTGSSTEPGLLETPEAGNAGGTQVTYPAYPLRPFIDQDEPTVQVAATTNGGFLTRNLTNSTAWDYYSMGWGAIDYPDGGVEYDSRSNTFFFWSDAYRKAVGIGTTPEIMVLDSGRLPRPTYLKAGASPNTLFAATLDGRLYKLSATDQAVPTLTRLDGGSFPLGSTISGVDVGATDNELIVTLSNYGIQSVWYTTDGGANWLSKDLPAHGLPDLPVYAVLINPTNRQQVMLATELGVWSTNDITAANPGWTLTNTGAPLVRCKQFIYRAADELVAVVTSGRGVWETNAWSLDAPIVQAGGLSTTALCAGTTLPVSYTLLNVQPSRVVVRLSDASGDFTNGTDIAAGTTSPLLATVPASVSSGTGYRLRLDVPDFSISQLISGSLTITNLSLSQASILDRRQLTDARLADVRYVSGYVCPGDSALLRAYLPNQPNNLTATYRWAIDGQTISGQTTASLATGQTGTYSFTASVGSCTTTSANNLLLIAIDAPTVSVLSPINTDDGPICPGTSVPLGTSYLGQRAVYQWLRNGEAVSGGTTPVFSATATGSYAYRLTFSSSGGATCAASAPATYLTVNQTILPPTIAVAGDVAPTTCGTASLTLYATSQPDGTTYQWLREGRVIAGQTSSLATVSQGGTYRLQVQRGTCTAVSDPITVTANSQLSNGLYYYGSTTLCTGESLVLYAKNTSHALQWTKNNVPITGATGFSYLVDTPGSYALRYTSGSCSGTAVAVSVVFSQTLTPTLLLNERCTEVELSTRDYPRTGTVTFSWLRNGQPVSQGVQTYQTVTESGLYSVSVTNGVCSGVSKPVSVSIGQPVKPTIAALGGLVRCPTSAVKLQRTSGPYSFWRFNGSPLPGATSDQVVAAETGVYSLVYQQGSCLTESASVSVVIGQPASATIAGQPFIRSGQSAVLPVQLSGVAPWSFSVVGVKAVTNTYQNPYSLTVTPSRTTSYSLINVANGCGIGAGAVTVINVFVDGADVSLTSWVSKRSCQLGDTITYSVRVTNAGPDAAENVSVINRLPSGLSYVGSSSATTGDSLRLSVGNVPAGESRLVSFKTKINRRGKYVNAVELVACNTPDPDSQPNTGTADGEDDATLVDLRTADTTRYLAVSPNPYGRILPTVASNQPAAIPNQADLSVALFVNKRLVLPRDTIQVTLVVQNQGGTSTSLVQTGLTLPNGTYSLDKTTWRTASTAITIDIGQMAASSTVSRTVYWLPTASDSCRVEVIRSAVADPDSTPNNRSTRPGEDDDAVVDVRMLR